MKKQNRNDKLDERLGMLDGPERTKSVSFRARRDESRAMKRYWEEKDRREKDHRSEHRREYKFDFKDNMQSWIVRSIPTDTVEKDSRVIERYKTGNKGYPEEAF